MNQYQLEVTEAHAGTRLDVLIAGQGQWELSRSEVQRLLDEGHVTVTGPKAKQKASYKVEPGDRITVTIPDPVPLDLVAEAIPLDVVYEDDDLLVINKARGMVVHPAAGHWSGTLVNAVLGHVDDELEEVGGEMRPGIVHRLDKDTTGLLVVAKTPQAHHSLADQIRERTAKREYLALVHGAPPVDTGTVDAPIGRHPKDRKRMAVTLSHGRHAVTHFRVLERYSHYALLQCRLETGRTHQIRVHMAYIGHPVVGDPVYGTRKQHLGMTAQALHARLLSFTHPRTGELLEFTAEPPADMQEAIAKAREA